MENKYLAPIAIHPGEHIKEIIESPEMNQNEFADRLGISAKCLSEIINAKTGISIDTADKLSKMFGSSVLYWINLQNNYEETLIRIKEQSILQEELMLTKKLDLKSLSLLLLDLEIVKTMPINEELVTVLRQAFKVSSLKNIKDIYAPQFKQTQLVKNNHDFEISVWIQIAELFAQKIKNLNIQKPEYFISELKSYLVECGVALVILPHFKGTGIRGVTKKISRNKVMIALSLHGKTADKFWFTLLHEIYHACNLNGKAIFVCYDRSNGDYVRAEEERNADIFAAETLINSDDLKTFCLKGITAESIEHFSKENNVLPCILTARLKYEKFIPYSSLNEYTEKYCFTTK